MTDNSRLKSDMSVFERYNVDDLRREQFPQLTDDGNVVFLDHAATGIPSAHQIEAAAVQQRSALWGNPHSGAATSSILTTEAVARVRRTVLRHFRADADEYEVVFTRSATGAIKLLGENFNFSRVSATRVSAPTRAVGRAAPTGITHADNIASGGGGQGVQSGCDCCFYPEESVFDKFGPGGQDPKPTTEEASAWGGESCMTSCEHTCAADNCSGSVFAYTEDNHTSVVGLREIALSRGAAACVLPLGHRDGDTVVAAEATETATTTDETRCCTSNASGCECGLAARADTKHPSICSNCSSGKPRQTRHENQQRPQLQKPKSSHEGHCLFAYPAQSNFNGRRYPLKWAEGVRSGNLRLRSRTSKCCSQLSCSCPGRWLVLLDAASYVSSGVLDLSPPSAGSGNSSSSANCNHGRSRPDFVCISFYKMFGLPTGVGALLVRRGAQYALRDPVYFGGGTLRAYSARQRFHLPRTGLAERLESGTLPFAEIAALEAGFTVLRSLRMDRVSLHTHAVASRCAAAIERLHHYNGQKVAVIYWGGVGGIDSGCSSESDCKESKEGDQGDAQSRFGPSSAQGPILCFNLRRSDGSWVAPSEVAKLATMHGIHLRTGCVCNSGACHALLGVSGQQLQENVARGYSCGDGRDLMPNGRPMGAVRISFGYMSTAADAGKFVRLLVDYFCDTAPLPRDFGALSTAGAMAAITDADTTTRHHENADAKPPADTDAHAAGSVAVEARLVALHVYPVKSCAAFSPSAWPVGPTGLLYDREWMIVDEEGACMTQKRLPAMCHVRPLLLPDLGLLTLSHYAQSWPLMIPLRRGNFKSSFSASLTKWKHNYGVAEEGEEEKEEQQQQHQQQEEGDGLQDNREGGGRLGHDRVCNAVVCQDEIVGSDCGPEAARWLSAVLGRSVRLLRCRKGQQRYISANLASAAPEAARLSFANESPFLLVSSSSMTTLNAQWRKQQYHQGQARQRRGEEEEGLQDGATTAMHNQEQEIPIDRFRANLVVAGSRPFAEDGWSKISLGSLDLVCVGPCQRCQMVCIDQATGYRSSEPLRTLTRFRRLQGRTYFGQHVALADTPRQELPARLVVGDRLVRATLSTRPPPSPSNS